MDSLSFLSITIHVCLDFAFVENALLFVVPKVAKDRATHPPTPTPWALD